MIYNPTPIQQLANSVTEKAGIRLLIKREDLNHNLISGNKWWKLKYNVQQARTEKKNLILTFGGAYSNHIYATASAAKESNLECIGVIRGEKLLPLNKTLTHAASEGMLLHYISREDYRKKDDEEFVQNLREKFGDFYLIPEGGTNASAVKGCAEFASYLIQEVNFDYACLPVGTGGTIAGFIAGLKNTKEVIGISVLKNGEFLSKEITKLIHNYNGDVYGNWTLLTSYHHGGYAKATKELLDFVSAMKERHNLPLDHVYTGKLFWAVMQEIEKGRFERGSTVLAIHTGGLQGAY